MRSFLAYALVSLAVACSSSDEGGLGPGPGGDGAAGTGGTGDMDGAGGAATGGTSGAGGTAGSGGTTGDDAGDTAGTGGTGSDAAPDTGPTSPHCMTSIVGTGAPALVDDFEDGNPMLLPNDGRVGEWSFSKSATAVTMPATGGPLTPVVGGDGVPTSKALHIAGTETIGWGADITANLVYSEGTGCYDASAYTGIKLSIKGRAGAKVFMIARVATIRAMEATAGHYRKEHVLTADWQEVTLRWADFGPSWGTPPEPKVVNPRELYSISVLTAPGAGGQVGEFDVWIDNVELTR
jgi:Complex I intermediate-associated protein 30 (CIA30)